MNTIISKLDDLAWKAGMNVPALNSGGCAVFAHEVAKRLADMGIPVTGVVAMADYYLPRNTADWPSIDTARKAITDVSDGLQWNDNGVDFHHVGIEFTLDGQEYHFDSSGVSPAKQWMNRQDWKVLPGRLTVAELNELVKNPWNWNPAFDRDRGIPQIRRLVKATLT